MRSKVTIAETARYEIVVEHDDNATDKEIEAQAVEEFCQLDDPNTCFIDVPLRTAEKGGVYDGP